MPRNDTQEPLQPFPPPFDNFVREPVRKYFARERRDVDSCGFALEYVAEGFEVRVSPSDEGVTEFKGGNVSLTDYLIIGVHLPPETMSLRIPDFNLQETLWDTIHFLDGLLSA